jgi:hypothetical protein
MQDVFRAATLSFLTASLYLLLSAAIDFVAIHLLGKLDPEYAADASFSMALATTSLLASLLCVWVLLVTAFARKYVCRLRPGSTFLAAFVIVVPLVLADRLLPLFDPGTRWSPIVSLLFSLLWSSVGLHAVLWYLTIRSPASSNAA